MDVIDPNIAAVEYAIDDYEYLMGGQKSDIQFG